MANNSDPVLTQWVDLKERECFLLHGGHRDDLFFLAMMKNILTVFPADKQDSEETDDFASVTLIPYRNDTAFFEVRCYLCYLMHFWFAKNKHDLCQPVCKAFNNRFVVLFIQIFKAKHVKAEDVWQTFVERFECYSELEGKEFGNPYGGQFTYLLQ
ncbi:MAG TPA: hypothetical protein VEF34_14820 [Syntrophobacteraceae bacterium]|nr:hypothetical protein [Syntrophobacteraceae bacterium]